MRKYQLVISLAYGDDYYNLEMYQIEGGSKKAISSVFDGVSPSSNYIEQGAHFIAGIIAGLRSIDAETRIETIHAYAKNNSDVVGRFARLC